MMMVKIAAEVRTLSTRQAMMARRERRHRARPIRKAPPAPMPAASVAVKSPPYMPPMMNTKSSAVAQMSLSDARRSCRPALSPRGSSSGRKAR